MIRNLYVSSNYAHVEVSTANNCIRINRLINVWGWPWQKPLPERIEATFKKLESIVKPIEDLMGYEK